MFKNIEKPFRFYEKAFSFSSIFVLYVMKNS